MDTKLTTTNPNEQNSVDLDQDSTVTEMDSRESNPRPEGSQPSLFSPGDSTNVEPHGPNDQIDTAPDSADLDDPWEIEGQVLLVVPQRKDIANSSNPNLEVDSIEPYVLYSPRRNRTNEDHRRHPGSSSMIPLKSPHSQLQDTLGDQPGKRTTKIGILRKQKKESDIQFPVPRNLRGHSWLADSANKFNLETSGYSYEGEINDNQIHGNGCLYIGDEQQFFEGKWSMNHLEELHRCQFTFPRSNITVSIVRKPDNYLLTMEEIHFSASVTLSSLDELDITMSTQRLKKSLLEKVTVQEILKDDLKRQRDASFDSFISVLQRLVHEDTDQVVRATILVLMKKSLKPSQFVMTDLAQNKPALEEFRVAAKNLLISERRYLNNASNFFKTLHKTEPLKMHDILSEIHRECITKHRQMLVSKCPQALPRLASEIQQMDDDMIVYITKEDIAVFDHIVSQPCFGPYRKFFEDLEEKFYHKIRHIKTQDPSDVMPIMPTAYGFLVKSFWECNLEIIEAIKGYKPEDLLKCESGNWKLDDDILQRLLEKEKNGSSKLSSPHHTSVVQCKVIFRMMKRFSPENDNPNNKNDVIKSFVVLDQGLSSCEEGLEVAEKTALAKRIEQMPRERVVWIQLLDLIIQTELKDEADNKTLLKPYTPLLERYISDVEKLDTENHELLRVVTQNVGKFIISTTPCFRGSHEKTDVDVNILVDQISLFSTAVQDSECNNSAISTSRDLITEFNRYTSLRYNINIEPTPGYFSSKISTMMQTLMRIVANSLKKSVPTSTSVRYLRSLNDFLDDFKNIDFLAVWYVKSESHKPEVLKKIENKLADTVFCSYSVTHVEKYVAPFLAKKQSPPDHCIIQIVSQLLECIEKCLEKKWQSDQLAVAQLESSSVMLDVVRRSFKYLKEQPDYLDFDTFKKESVDPFNRLQEECSTVDDLGKRANIVNESFWYIRKMDEIGIDQALAMFKKDNTSLDLDKLLDGYNRYLTDYGKYIAEYSHIISNGGSHSEGLEAVKKMIDFRALVYEWPYHYSKWTVEFKTTKVPAILAGLSALWSVLTSRDVSGTGKFLKPHCIQILCAMRLLGNDYPKTGVENHLAQVLTGQGKSVILALVSSVLAVTGHKVRVLCYSKYLSTRDQGDFEELFKNSQIPDEIRYGTFNDMSRKFLRPVCNGVELDFFSLVHDKIMKHTDWSEQGAISAGPEEVLLIDEVDVFFTKDFYGNTQGYVNTIPFSGLLKVQETMWSLASNKSKNYSTERIVELSQVLIKSEVRSKNSSMLELENFLSKPGSISLLVWGPSGRLTVKTYTNRSLFEEHLERMAEDAIEVANSKPDVDFRLNSEGIIELRNPVSNIFSSSIRGYENTFNYFRLKKSNFDSKYFQNYGYLLVTCGYISYARLPLQHDLILGVSGTLANLGKYEQTGLDSYGLNKISIIPSFYGASNLKFNEKDDIHYFFTEEGWLKKIHDRAIHMVSSHRAVIIFFESDQLMAAFTKEYSGKFSRMNVITANTAATARDAFIEEAGLTGAVTLATREMGRGVDFKSTLSAEKNGGVHVIQTFYSTDIKEEVQIKGRTARKDNKGSYEMIICREHLVRNYVIWDSDRTTHTYASLDSIRRQISDRLGETVKKRLQDSEEDHNTTMKYFGLM